MRGNSRNGKSRKPVRRIHGDRACPTKCFGYHADQRLETGYEPVYDPLRGSNEPLTKRASYTHFFTVSSVGDVIVRVDPRYFRPAEVETLLGDPSKAKDKLVWVPEITVEKMCAEMVAHDLDVAKCHALLKSYGHDVAVSKE